MSWYAWQGSRIFYEDSGIGDPVLLLPGWGGSVTDLDRLRSQLVQGFRVIAVDLPGAGRSEPKPRHYTPEYYHDDARVLIGLLDELGIERAHLVGFSDGGEECLLIAGVDPARALSVLTWGASGFVSPSPERLDALARAIDEPGGEFVELAAFVVEAYGLDNARVMLSSWSAAMRGISNAGGDVSRSRADRIRCPALLIAGAYDPICPAEEVRTTAALIPRGEFRAIDAGHDLHHSHADWLGRAVLDWLAAH